MKRKLLLSFGILILLIIAVFWGIYYFLNTERQRRFLEDKITTILQRETHIQKVHLQLFPRIQLIIKGVEIEGLDEKSEFIFLKKLRLGIALRPLLTGTIYFDFLSLNHPRIILTRNQQRKLNISNLFQVLSLKKEVKEKNGKAWFKQFRFFLKKFMIQKGEIIYKDYSLSPTPITFRFIDLHLQTGNIFTARIIPVNLRCYLEGREKRAQIKLQGKINTIGSSPTGSKLKFTGNLEVTDLNISSFNSYLRGMKLIDSADGIINGTALIKGLLGEKFETEVSLEVINLKLENQKLFEKKVEIDKTKLYFSLIQDKNRITFPQIILTFPKLKATGKLTFNRIDIPIVESELKVEEFEYQDILPYLPFSVFPHQIKTILKEKFESGKIDRLFLKYTETFPDLSEASPIKKSRSFEGNLGFHDFSLTIFDDLPPIKQLNGKLSFDNGNFNITDLTGSFGRSEIEHGSITLSKVSFLDTSAELKLDLFEINQILHSKIIPRKAQRHLKNLRSMKGKALLTLDASGPLNDLSSITFGGKLELLNATLDYQPFRKVTRNLNGIIQFTPYRLSLIHI